MLARHKSRAVGGCMPAAPRPALQGPLHSRWVARQGCRTVSPYHACKHVLQAALAASLVAEEWPDASELAADRAAARDAATPVPERVWALRNVAATAAMSGAGGVARAVQLLDKALALKQEWVGSAEHPSEHCD
jgi:hypothetical protein